MVVKLIYDDGNGYEWDYEWDKYGIYIIPRGDFLSIVDSKAKSSKT